jgi:prephenate dehydratase
LWSTTEKSDSVGLADSASDLRVKNAIEELGKFSRVKILGSYERAM